MLRPLYWWLLLVLLLYGYRLHQRMMEQTRINFGVTLEGKDAIGAMARLDGAPVITGAQISLGRHTFTVTHPKTTSFSTNFFGWYGGSDFGQISLVRTMGTLQISASPSAETVTITGPEFSTTLHEVTTTNLTVPTDSYTVGAEYAHWDQTQAVTVSANQTASCVFAPRLGAAQITCNEADAAGQFLQADGKVIETVTFPYSISELPEGRYIVTAQHRSDVQSQTVSIKAGTTNTLSLEFLYGSAALNTEPSGASVRTEDGRYWGVTPLTMTELKPGSWTFSLERNGYEAVTASLIIKANQAATFQTNLVSVNFTDSMKVARLAMNADDYDGALKAASDALIAKPGDTDALALQSSATGLRSLKLAKKLGLQGDFIGGAKELGTALAIFPENAEVKALFADYKRREPEQRERIRLERLERGNIAFANALRGNSDANLFDTHELKTAKPVNEVYPAILNALKTPPAFKIAKNFSPAPETYEIEFVQEFSTYLATSAGRREGVIICAQTKDDETQILFKILEYTTEAKIKFSIGNLIGTPVAVNYVPISSSRLGPLSEKLQARLNEGVTNVTARVQGAIEQKSSSVQ